MSDRTTVVSNGELERLKAGIRKLYDDIVFSDEKVVVATRLRELLNGIYDE